MRIVVLNKRSADWLRRRAVPNGISRTVGQKSQFGKQGGISTASGGKDIFQMVGWSRSAGSFNSPPFVDPESGATLVNPEDKRDRTLLQQAAYGEDKLN